MAEVVDTVPVWRRSFWKVHTEDRRWAPADDGGFWWYSPVLIERRPLAPQNGQRSTNAVDYLQRLEGRETVDVPDECTVSPGKYLGDAWQCNFGKVGRHTLLLNADFVAHIAKRGYRMAQIVGDGMEPVLLYKGDRLMGLVMPQASPEYVERWHQERRARQS